MWIWKELQNFSSNDMGQEFKLICFALIIWRIFFLLQKILSNDKIQSIQSKIITNWPKFKLTLGAFPKYTPFSHLKVTEHDPKANLERPVHPRLLDLTFQKHWHRPRQGRRLHRRPRHTPKGCRDDVSGPKWWLDFGTYGVPKFLLKAVSFEWKEKLCVHCRAALPDVLWQ